MQVPFAAADHQWHIARSQAADSASSDRIGGEPGCPGRRSNECALAAGGARESAGESGARERTTGQPPAHHHQHSDRTMEHRRSRTIAGLVRGARICFCGAVRADGENAEFGATAKSELPSAGGQDHRPAAPRSSAHQWHAANDRDAAALRRFSVLSDDVPPGVSQWRCFLSLRAAAQGCRQFAAGWILEEDLRAREEDLWRYSALPGDLLPVWKCAVALLRERLLGLGGRFYTLSANPV